MLPLLPYGPPRAGRGGFRPVCAPLIAVLAVPACTAPPGDDLSQVTLAADPRFADLVAWTEARMEEWHIPGAAIAVVEDGELRHVAGLGVRRWGFPEPVTPDTRFRVGSLSKMVAGALAAEEAAAGRLDLDASAADVLGDLALHTGSFADFTLLQLLSHEAGLQTIGLPNRCDPDPERLAEELAELTPEWDLWTPPGELYLYANQGYGLAGLAVERSAASWSGGATYPELAQRLFDGAGMTTATYDWVEAFASDHAVGHTMDLATGVPERYRNLDERACVASYPSGGLMASVTDVGRMVEVLVAGGEGWVSPEAWEIMTTRGFRRTETSGYGFGLASTSYDGHPSLTHHGSVGGYFAMAWAIPEERLGVAVLVNVSHAVTEVPEPGNKPTHRIMWRALDTFLGLEEEERTSSVRPVEEWGRFVGVYRSEFDLGTVTVALDGDTLWYADHERVVELQPYSRDSFQYAVADDDGDLRWHGVSFEEGTGEDISWILTEKGVARKL